MATALDKALLHVAAEQHVNAMQRRGGNGIRARTCSCSARSAAIRINGGTGTRNSTAPHRPELTAPKRQTDVGWTRQ